MSLTQVFLEEASPWNRGYPNLLSVFFNGESLVPLYNSVDRRIVNHKTYKKNDQ